MAPSRSGVPITGSVLQWAIQESGYTPDQVAENVGVDLDELRAWINEDTRPSRTEIDSVARQLKRPTALFFLPAPPKVSRRPVTFRHPRRVERDTLSPPEHRFLRYCRRLQENLAWMLRESDAKPVRIPSLQISDDHEEAGRRLRNWLKLDELTCNARNNYDAFSLRREAFQSKGIVVCVLTVGRDEAQGFALSDNFAPLIAINSTGWNPASRSYSLLHELSHLALRSDSACYQFGARRREYAQHGEIELWCNRVAAAALIPEDQLESVVRDFLGVNRAKVESIEDAGTIANRFKVSLRAAVVRLIALQMADWTLWDNIPPLSDVPQRGGGGGMSRAQRRLNEVGTRTIHVVLNAERRGVIGRSNVHDLLGLGDRDIRTVATASGLA